MAEEGGGQGIRPSCHGHPDHAMMPTLARQKPLWAQARFLTNIPP